MATKSKKQIEQKPKFPPFHPDWRSLRGHIPTRTFDIGEMVKYGIHDHAQIEEIFYHKNVPVSYGIKVWGIKNNYGKQVDYEEYRTVNWHNLYKLDTINGDTNFTKNVDYYIRYSNCDVESLISKVLSDYAGVDFSPIYQREYVWEYSDKEYLLDSIFNNIDIGRFVFVKLPYSENEMYEILDGKQRLSTLVDFYEDRLQYRGKYFSELSFKDVNKFLGHGIIFGELNEPTLKQKLEAFIALNTSGKVMDQNHLQEVVDKLKELN